MQDVNVTGSSLLRMAEAQGYRCAISGREITPELAALDHKQPLSRGGEHDIRNVWIVHKDVNAAKGVMTVDEFIAMCCDVAANKDAVLASFGRVSAPVGGVSSAST